MVTKRLVRIEEGKVVAAVAAEDEENLVIDINQLPKNSNGDADTKKAAPPTKKPGDSQLGSIGKSDNCHGRSKQDASTHINIMPDDVKIDKAKSAASVVPNVGSKKSIRSKKRHIPLENEDIDGKKQRTKIDLSDVPAQQPILKIKSGGKSNSITSKYQGVSFNKSKNKWEARIMIDGARHQIGTHDNEEAAAIDYARAVFKYAPKKLEQMRIDLTDVPDQPPILSGGGKKDGIKYQGVFFNKVRNKWVARIMIDGKAHHIGCYDSEYAAAVDYARAVFKYVPQKLTNVDQPPIPSASGKSGSMPTTFDAAPTAGVKAPDPIGSNIINVSQAMPQLPELSNSDVYNETVPELQCLLEQDQDQLLEDLSKNSAAGVVDGAGGNASSNQEQYVSDLELIDIDQPTAYYEI